MMLEACPLVFCPIGMRRSELMGLKLEDVDRERRWLPNVQGKNRKDRVVPIG